MTALTRGLYVLRRNTVEWWGMIVSLAFAALIGLGVFVGPVFAHANLLVLSAVLVFGVTLARTLMREIMPEELPRDRGLARALHELELGLLLLTGAFVLISATGGVGSFLYPLIYALVSFLLVVHERRWVALVWVAWSCVLEVLVGLSAAPLHGAAPWPLVGTHLTFILFFSAGNALILTGLTRRLRGDHGRRMDAELARMRQEARDFRLIASQLPAESRAVRSREDEELRMAQGAVHAIHEQLFFTIDLLCSSLHLHTCALLWIQGTPPGQTKGREVPRLVIKELATSSDMVRETPVLDGPGVLSAVVRDPKPLRLKNLKGKRVPPYYAGPEAVTDLLAVPLLDGQAVRGFLCADRISDRAFSEAEEAVLTKAAEHVLRVIEQERSFAAVERSKYEQEQFYRASELLNEALTFEHVHGKTFDALTSIVPCGLCVMTLFDEGAGRHKVIGVRLDASLESDRAWRDTADQLADCSFEHGGGLVSMAVKNRHHMPATGDLADPETVIFDQRLRLRKAKSLLVLPLMRGDNVLGTVVLASPRANQFPPALREMLRVITHQVSVSLQNARMYQAMEERATTDGLTGLTNHRAFQERYEQLHALCDRTGQSFSVILTDVDHFKSVNDTYGHPVGDAVLKRVAAILAGRARKVDIVARYGGEEFVLVLPDTDGEGAALFANRLREEIGAQTMTSDHGNFNVTISMGVASFPDDSRDRKDLIEKADQALYYCKEHGRNCVTRWADT